jgi:hypothetical protein
MASAPVGESTSEDVEIEDELPVASNEAENDDFEPPVDANDASDDVETEEPVDANDAADDVETEEPVDANDAADDVETEEPGDADDAGDDAETEEPGDADDAGDDDDPWNPGDEVDEDSGDEGSDDSDSGGPDVPDDGGSDSGGAGDGDAPSDGGSDSSDDQQEDSGDDNARGPMQGIGEGPIDFWEPHGVLQALLDGTPDGGVLDVRGRGFFVVAGEVFRVNQKSIQILGGHFTGAIELDWSPIGNNLFEAPVDLTQLTDFRLLLIDPKSDAWPLSAQRPLPPAVRFYDRFTYNSNWWIVNNQNEGIDNGAVLTVDGPDEIGSVIQGIRIDDPVMRAAVTAEIGDDDPASISLMYHAGPNLIMTDRLASWSPGTGVMMFAGLGSLTYEKYFRFCLAGSSRYLTQPGEYAIDLANDRVIYWPMNGDASKARLPMTDQIFRFLDADIEFVDSTFTGNLTSPGGGGMISSGTPPARITLRGCHLHSCQHGVRSGTVDIDRSVIEHMTDRGITVSDGSKVTRSVFRHIQNRSGILVMCDGSDPTDAVEQTIIRDNYFHIPASAHGQGVSLYKDAWQNARIEHNIFDDCERAFSFQPNSNSAARRTDAHSLVFANNLVIYDDATDQLGGGQAVISFNGAADTHLPLDTVQSVHFRHNTILAREEILADPRSYTLWSVDLNKLIHSDVKVESNVAGLINASRQDDEIGSLPHWHFGNLSLLERWGASYGEYDLPNPGEIGEIFSWDSLQVEGYARSAASDGGPVGIRWQTIPSAASLETLGPDWASVYPAEEPPVASLLGWVYFDEDRR